MTSYLLTALEQARHYQGFCAPNPAVGAVVVKENRILATGYHRGSGTTHAEVDALNKISFEQSQNATLYVTLEPCCIHGRTPPCTNLIIERQLDRVVYAYQDPNPKVAGQGAQQLQAAGIVCEQTPVAEINEFYQAYAYWWQHQLPFTTAKLAISADGKIAGEQGQPLAITGEKTNQFTHQQRLIHDAIITTVKTIQRDDPKLNVRLDNDIYSKPIYILDKNLELPENAQVRQTAQTITLFHQPEVDSKKRKQLIQAGIRCVPITLLTPYSWKEASKSNRKILSLLEIREQIAQDGIHSLWCEAGAHCFINLIQSHNAQRVFLYQSSKRLGNTALNAHLPTNLFKDFSEQKIRQSGADQITLWTGIRAGS